MGNRKRATTTKTEDVLNIERERRMKMKQMFTHLATTVPTLYPNVTNIIPSFSLFIWVFNFSLLNANIYLIDPLSEMGFCYFVFLGYTGSDCKRNNRVH